MDTNIDIKEREKSYLEDVVPKNWVVYLLNDDYTSMDFVVEVLIQFFMHDVKTALEVMLKVHNEGRGACGIYPYEIAETKVSQVHEFAKVHEYPLRAIIEQE